MFISVAADNRRAGKTLNYCPGGVVPYVAVTPRQQSAPARAASIRARRATDEVWSTLGGPKGITRDASRSPMMNYS
jgi:hypothetical protein